MKVRSSARKWFGHISKNSIDPTAGFPPTKNGERPRPAGHVRRLAEHPFGFIPLIYLFLVVCTPKQREDAAP